MNSRTRDLKWLFLSVLLITGSAASALTVQKMTCNMQSGQLMMTVGTPRFGWVLMSDVLGDAQKAYQIKISSTTEKAKKGEADVWDSGKTSSDQSQLVQYTGKPLTPGQSYFWTVSIWGTKSKQTGQPEIACFRLAPSRDQLVAGWIGAITKAESHLPDGRNWHVPSFKEKKVQDAWNAIDTLALKSIQLRKAMTLKKQPVSAIVYISGLGQYELSLNGQKVGECAFDPLWSDYDKTVYYSAYDVTGKLAKGQNVLGVLLGNGFYNAVGNRYNKLWVSFGPPTLFLQLELTYADGSRETICSDQSWHYSLSPITFNSLYGGESYDARLEQKGWDNTGFIENKSWKPVVVQEAPRGELRPEVAPGVKVMNHFPVKSVNKLAPGSYVLNMGQNLSGYPQIKVKGKKGDVIRLTVSELLDKDGRVSQKQSGGPYYLEYTLKGEGEETWSPEFTYYGYQYIQLDSVDLYTAELDSKRPLVLDVQSLFVHNSARETGTFTCSNSIYDSAHVLIQNAVKSNFQGVFTDCPHREKLGWLEQDYLNGPGLLYNYDLTNFLPKLVQDMQDAQHPNGLVPSIAPEYVVFGDDFSDSPEWGVASVIVPWLYYEYYGDTTLIRKAYPMMKRYVDYLSSKATNNILSYGLGDWYDYGLHPAGYSKNSPISISATAHYYYGIKYLARAARLLGYAADSLTYDSLATTVRKSYIKRFFDPETKQYGNGSQYCNAVSLYMGLVEADYKKPVLLNLIKDVREHGYRLTTGDIGNRYLFQTLADNGMNEVMHMMNNHHDAPGYGYQLQYGVTTLTEQWDPKRGSSWNHFMMGQIDEWFYKSLAGIQADMDHPGFKHFFVKPASVEDLASVDASFDCLYGTIRVSWKRTDKSFDLTVNVPVNTTATVVLPIDVTEARLNGKHVDVVNKSLDIHSGISHIQLDILYF